MYGSRLDNVYAIDLHHISPMHISCLKTSFNEVWLWHCRLGHASMHTLHQLVRHDLVRKLHPNKYKKNHVRSACVRVSKYVQPLNLWKKVSTLRCLKLLHMDHLWTNLY